MGNCTTQADTPYRTPYRPTPTGQQLTNNNETRFELKTSSGIKKMFTISVNASITGFQLKQIIYLHVCQQLTPQRMNLLTRNQLIANDRLITKSSFATTLIIRIEQQRATSEGVGPIFNGQLTYQNEARIELKNSGGEIKLFQISVPTSLTGLQLKKMIYLHGCQSLTPQQMNLFTGKQKILNDKIIPQSSFAARQIIRIQQQKAMLAELHSIKGVRIFPKQVDPITEEIGVAEMACGHRIGRDSMNDIIKNLIEFEAYIIRCPHVSQRSVKCNEEWDLKTCFLVGVLTKKEIQSYQNGLSLNYLKKFTKKCPNPNINCPMSLIKGPQRSDKGSCPSCHFTFCFFCLEKWTSNDGHCNGQQCIYLDKMLTNSPWTRVFNLKDRGTRVENTYNLPKERSCTNCKSILENTKKCKHTTCTFCKSWSFCWVCLASPGDSGWPCGGAYDYCGVIAPTQILASHRQN